MGSRVFLTEKGVFGIITGRDLISDLYFVDVTQEDAASKNLIVREFDEVYKKRF